MRRSSSRSAATRVYATAAYRVAALVAVLIGFCPKFGAVVAATPGGVLGGIALGTVVVVVEYHALRRIAPDRGGPTGPGATDPTPAVTAEEITPGEDSRGPGAER